MYSLYNHFKDVDGKYTNQFTLQRVGARCEPIRIAWHSPSRVDLVKAKASNEIRVLPLQSVTLFEVGE